MPITQFICPDKVRIDIKDCLSECRMADRCMTLPTLLKASESREWDGTPHVTNLIGGTREYYLQIHHDTAIDPKSTMYSQLGTAYHAMLEELAKELDIPAEINFHRPGVIQGTSDLLQPNGDGSYDLIDYKTWGSYKVKMALGIKYKKNPNHLGSDRRHKDYWTFYKEASAIDNRDAELQLNKYRMELETLGYPIDRMFVQATVRDGGLQAAKNVGVVSQLYMIPVQRLPDDVVMQYFTAKGALLRMHIDAGTVPDVCTAEERWNGDMKCKKFCDVAEFCSYGRQWVNPPVTTIPTPIPQNEVAQGE